jgi:hypothetical protein
MGLVRNYACHHHGFAEMHGTMIAAIADRFHNMKGLGSLRHCLDRNQTNVQKRRQALKAPVHDPLRSQWMRLEHFSIIVAERGVPLAFGEWR